MSDLLQQIADRLNTEAGTQSILVFYVNQTHGWIRIGVSESMLPDARFLKDWMRWIDWDAIRRFVMDHFGYAINYDENVAAFTINRDGAELTKSNKALRKAAEEAYNRVVNDFAKGPPPSKERWIEAKIKEWTGGKQK